MGVLKQRMARGQPMALLLLLAITAAFAQQQAPQPPKASELLFIQSVEVREANSSRVFDASLYELDLQAFPAVSAKWCARHRIDKCEHFTTVIAARAAVAARHGPVRLAVSINISFVNETGKRLFTIGREQEPLEAATEFCQQHYVEDCAKLEQFAATKQNAGRGIEQVKMHVSIAQEEVPGARVQKEQDAADSLIELALFQGDHSNDRARTACLLYSVPMANCAHLSSHLSTARVAKGFTEPTDAVLPVATVIYLTSSQPTLIHALAADRRHRTPPVHDILHGEDGAPSKGLAAPPREAVHNLPWLLGDHCTVERFFSEYWGKKPLVVSRHQPGYYHELMTAEDLEAMFGLKDEPSLEFSTRVLVVNASFGQAAAYADMYEGYVKGGSIIMNFVEALWRPVALLLDRLMRHFFFTGVNLYLTPSGGGRALPLHNDDQDVVLLQVAGSKDWQVFEPPATAKAPYKEHVIGKPHSKPGTQRANATRLGLKSVLNTTVHAGDLIYIPRGFPHMANSRPGELSMHLTLTAPTAAFSWGKLLSEAVQYRVAENPQWREAAPRGSFSTHHKQVLQGLAALKQARPKLPDVMSKFFDTGACEHMSSRTIWSQTAVLCLQHTVGVNTVVAVAPVLAAKHSTEQQLLEACPECCSRAWSSFFPMCEAWGMIVAAGAGGVRVATLMAGRDHFGKVCIAKTLIRLEVAHVVERGAPASIDDLHGQH